MAELYLVTGPCGRGYVGVTRLTAIRRFRKHVNDAKRLVHSRTRAQFYNSILTNGSDSFEVKTLFVGPWEVVLSMEDSAITEFNTMQPEGFNSKHGKRGD